MFGDEKAGVRLLTKLGFLDLARSIDDLDEPHASLAIRSKGATPTDSARPFIDMN